MILTQTCGIIRRIKGISWSTGACVCIYTIHTQLFTFCLLGTVVNVCEKHMSWRNKLILTNQWRHVFIISSASGLAISKSNMVIPIHYACKPFFLIPHLRLFCFYTVVRYNFAETIFSEIAANYIYSLEKIRAIEFFN